MTAMNLHRYPSPSGGFALGKMGAGATMLKQGKTARDYVQSGLVAMWDGIENAGWGVHDASATDWTNLVDGSGEATPYGAAWLDNAMTMDGNTSVFNIFDASAVLNSHNFTIEVLVSRSVSYGAVFPGINAADANSLYVYPWYGSRSGVYVYGSKVHSYIEGANKRHVVFTGDGTNILTYFDGSHDGTTTQDTAITYTGKMYWRRGIIYAVRVYSRALTADEIAHNYAIDKERFNLP